MVISSHWCKSEASITDQNSNTSLLFFFLRFPLIVSHYPRFRSGYPWITLKAQNSHRLIYGLTSGFLFLFQSVFWVVLSCLENVFYNSFWVAILCRSVFKFLISLWRMSWQLQIIRVQCKRVLLFAFFVETAWLNLKVKSCMGRFSVHMFLISSAIVLFILTSRNGVDLWSFFSRVNFIKTSYVTDKV